MSITHPAFQSLSRPGSRTVVMHRGRAVVPALLALLAVGGCSDESESAATSGKPVVTTEPNSLPATDIAGRPLATTTAPSIPTTSTSGIVVSISTSSTTLAPPGSEAALEAAVGSAEMALLDALRAPENEQLLAVVEAATAPDSPAQAELTSRYRARIGAGQSLEASAATPSAVTVESIDYLVDGEQWAVVTVCVVDGDVLVRRQVAGSNEEVVVIDEEPASARFVESFALVDQQWRLESRVILDYFSGGTSCPTS